MSKLPRVYSNLNREELYDEGLAMGKAAFQDGIKYKHSFFDLSTPRYQISNASPFGLTTIMFIPTLTLQATPEQQAYWLPLAKSGKINGAYCQTELGHGTFVRGIETTATLDFETDEFVIHSPSLTSTKFWPGAIGFACTHAIVVARLVVRVKDYGPHPFLVQFRSLDDGSPMPGIELGDLGMKMSYNGTCNGFAVFNRLRIPRTDMLMGNTTVSKDGVVMKSPQDKAAYATMVYCRIAITRGVAFQLAQAVTIATRYSTVRKQGLGPNGIGMEETSLMTYKSQHYRLLTLISKAYAIFFAWQKNDAEYRAMQMQQTKGDHASLPYNHNLAAGLKAWSTQTAADGAEDARKCCGGQGYLATSGLPEIVSSVTATATFEGENYVLWQQLGRYLFKCISLLEASKQIDKRMSYIADGFNAYISSPNQMQHRATHNDQFLYSEVQLSIFRHRALRLVYSTYLDLRVSESMMPAADAWNANMMSIISAARAHIEYYVLLTFTEYISNLPPTASKNLVNVLSDMRSLFALTTITSPFSHNSISFVEDGSITLVQLDTIRSLVNTLLESLVPDAIALTDAWDFSDASLCSAIGCYDGNVYERLMAWSRQIPINVNAGKKGGVYEKGWKAWVEPMIRSNL